MITLKNIGKIYTKEGNVTNALSGVNLTFEEGEFVAITGKSGSGKSTLLNVISGLDSYESGEMYIDGKPTSHYSKEESEEYNREMISFIFQDYNILESFTVLENVEFALTGIKDVKARRAKAREIVERVGLTDRMRSRGSQLSGGEKQRTVIARAIAKDSPIILADEPTGNLDSKTAHDVLALLKEISQGKLVIVVTHNYDDVKEYATRHVRMHDGMVETDERFDGKEAVTRDRVVDKYDFGDAHEAIFHVAKKGIGETRCSIRDTFALGVKRFASRPKATSVITMLLSIVLVAIFLLVGYVVSFTTPTNRFYIDKMDGRVLVTKNDNSCFTREEASTFKENVGASDYIMNDVFMDDNGMSMSVTGGIADSRINYGEYGMNFFLGIDDGSSVAEGKNATEGIEAVLSVPYSMKVTEQVGDRKYIVVNASKGLYRIALEMNIVGIRRSLRTKDFVPKILVSRGFYDKIALLMRNAEALQLMTKRDGEADDTADRTYYRADFEQIYFTNSLRGSNAEYYDSSYNIKEHMALYYENNANKMVRLNAERKGTLTSTTALSLSYDMIDEFAKDRTSRQISLVFADTAKKDAFIASNNPATYSVLDVDNYTPVKSKDELDNKLSRLMYFAVVLVVAVAIVMILVVALQRLLYSTKGDIAIFRTMGIDSRMVKRSTYVELFLSLIPAYVLVTIVALVMYFTPIGSAFYVMGMETVLMLVLCSALVLLLVARSYNNILYSEKIRKSLRRVNK